MLARRSRLAFRDGTVLHTPLLIPSFSSKGFRRHRGLSEVSEYLEYAETFLKDAALISAYDIGHKLLPKLSGLASYPSKLPYSAPKALFIDSGTYEARADPEVDLGRLSTSRQSAWGARQYQRCIAQKLDDRLSVVLVNYDKYGPLERQVSAAKRFFDRYPTYLRDFLIKPEKEGGQIDPDVIIKNADDLASFQLIGLTEKELGRTIIERMLAIARVRMGLDQAGIAAPIHVFGSLDPLLSPIYFVAGAEVFDGLAWLYLSSHRGTWIYPDQQAALNRNWHHHERQRWAVRLQGNLTMLENLQGGMARFVSSGGDWSVFESHSDVIRDAFETLAAKMEVV